MTIENPGSAMDYEDLENLWKMGARNFDRTATEQMTLIHLAAILEEAHPCNEYVRYTFETWTDTVDVVRPLNRHSHP